VIRSHKKNISYVFSSTNKTPNALVGVFIAIKNKVLDFYIFSSHSKSPDSGCFLTHPYFAAGKIPHTQPSSAQTITVKYQNVRLL
jgi:hypothetical protein